MCTLMASANKSLDKKNFHQVENVIKQLVHTSAVHSSRYEAQRVLHISMNTRWCMNQLLNEVTRSITIPPRWDVSPLHGYLPAFHQASLTIHWYPFILVDGKRQCKSKDTMHAQEHNSLTYPGLKAWLLNLILLEVNNNQLCQNDKTLTTRPPF